VQLPGTKDKAVVAAWTACATALRELKKPAAAAIARAKEVYVIHPVVRAAVDAILAAGTAGIKCFGDVVAADRIPADQIKPDLVFTSVRDAQPSLLSSVFFIENKQVGHPDDAASQCIAYLRRLLRELVHEWHSCRESGGVASLLSEDSIKALAKLFAVGAACDGATLRVVRVKSGVPEDCRDLAAVPLTKTLPAMTSRLLPFLPIDAKYDGGPVVLGTTPSDGFRALFCLLRCDPKHLTPDQGILSSITTIVPKTTAGATRTTKEEYTLQERLGRGGFADVYRGTLGAKPVVLKTARCTTLAIVKIFKAEADCLARLGGEDGLFPVLLKYTEVPAASTHVGASLRTPVLVFSSPLGATPLLQYLQRTFKAGELQKFADNVVRLLLRTVKVRSFCSPTVGGGLARGPERGLHSWSVFVMARARRRRLLTPRTGFMATSGQPTLWSNRTEPPCWCAGCGLFAPVPRNPTGLTCASRRVCGARSTLPPVRGICWRDLLCCV
jgi:hypothetical protein